MCTSLYFYINGKEVSSITGDSSAGKILWVEVLDSTGTRNSENVDSALFECDDSNETGAGNSQKGDVRTASGDGNLTSFISSANN